MSVGGRSSIEADVAGAAGVGRLSLEAAMNAVDTAVMLVDRDFHIVFVNSAYLRMFDLNEETCFSGSNYADILWILSSRGEYGNEDSVVDTVESRLEPIRSAKPVSWVRVRPDGRVVSIQGVPLEDGGYIYTYTDVTAEHRAAEDAEASYKATVIALADLAEYRDTETGDHVTRVSRLTYEMAREMRKRGTLQCDDDYCANLATASVLHDVGKVAIPDSILRKPGFLEPEERVAMQQHSATGAQVLAKAAFMAPGSRYLGLGVEVARHHHERYDGKGYPDGLAGEAIPLSARIVAVADVYDALTSERPYKVAWTQEKAVNLLREEAGKHFDPLVVDAFCVVMEERGKTPVIQWNESMSVGNPVMDRDHRALMGLINQLALENNRTDRIVLEHVLDELISYAEAHFAREEIFMAEIGFKGLAAHRKHHQRLTREVQAIRTKFLRGTHAIGDEIHEFLAMWLKRHILDEDMKYVAVARKEGR